MSQPVPTGAPLSDSDARLWSMLAHLSGIVLSFVGPLLIMLVFGPRSDDVKRNSVEALNFQITVAIGYIISFILMFIVIGTVLFLAFWIISIVLCVLVGLKANRGEPATYPFALRLVR